VRLANLTPGAPGGEDGSDNGGSIGVRYRMTEGLILEFNGVGREEYEAVNGRLGIDMETGEGDWPAGLLFHAGGGKPGGWVVFEVWESRQAQEQFMNGRLGRALEEGGISEPPTRVEWLDLAAHHNPPS
jgi:hypothetical protein